ncbi:MAG TPA: MBL fold metallo-hydrolase [Spirochaetota bacterium]|nr:MBL fold metallo-hydrolase [Spirochaetota bacterium]HQO40570.1 MBL fold metallo-hydrolase [Spirochaetota bacterium]
MKITDGVYSYVWNGVFENNCNSFYFAEPFNILFDPGLKNYTDQLLKLMEADGIDIETISYVINTHSHPDHIEGNVNFTKYDIPAGMHKDEIKFLKETGADFFRMLEMDFSEYKYDLELQEGRLQIGDHELEVYKTPGHSPASVCIYWREKKTLVCGDLVFDKSFGRFDFPGGNIELLRESINRISQLDIEHLLPGHMGIVSGRDNVQNNFKEVGDYLEMF